MHEIGQEEASSSKHTLFKVWTKLNKEPKTEQYTYIDYVPILDYFSQQFQFALKLKTFRDEEMWGYLNGEGQKELIVWDRGRKKWCNKEKTRRDKREKGGFRGHSFLKQALKGPTSCPSNTDLFCPPHSLTPSSYYLLHCNHHNQKYIYGFSICVQASVHGRCYSIKVFYFLALLKQERYCDEKDE